MKKLFLLLLVLSGTLFALTDTDADGVSDEADVCPRVYARSTNGCPTLPRVTVSSISLNSCLTKKMQSDTMIVVVTPVCDKNTNSCPNISSVSGIQACDPVYPIIFDKNGIPLVRGSIFVVDYTR